MTYKLIWHDYLKFIGYKNRVNPQKNTVKANKNSV